MFKYFKLFILLFIGLILKCVMMKIVDEGCNASQSCVAFRKDYFNLTAGNSFYKYHATYKNWNVAKEACAREGASLFYAESSDEAKAVTSFLKTHIRDKGLEDKGAWDPSKWIHVGIFRTSGTEFETIDGKPLSKVWHDWQTNEPNNVVNERCVQMNEDGKFNDVSCSYYESGFFCKKTLSLREQNLQKLCITNSKVSTLKMFVFWPNATVPFYINPDHFDEELQTAILKSLDTFAVKTCIKFIPVIVAPSEDQHVMTFINPKGLRRCKIEMQGHSNYNPHLIVLGYKCINTPQLDMIIMRALGLPFEHNRMSRDLYIDVLIENIEPSYLPLFTKECILPEALRKIPYDANSVMHFGERDYSKNGHKTIRFKKDAHRLDKKGLTDSDIKKIALVYGPECVARDRAEKVALCRTRYLSRRKREIVEAPANMSLRVNPNITPPPHKYT